MECECKRQWNNWKSEREGEREIERVTAVPEIATETITKMLIALK